MGVSTKSTQSGQFNQKSRVKPRWQLIHNHQNFVLCPIQLSELINQHIRVKKVRKEEERFEKHQKENHVFTRKQQYHFLQMITTLCMAYCYLSKKKKKEKDLYGVLCIIISCIHYIHHFSHHVWAANIMRGQRLLTS